MDAAQLIAATRHALARAGSAEAVVAEAWQTQALLEAVACHLTAGAGRVPAGGPVRAVRLTGVRDPRVALSQLLEMSEGVRAALVAVARSTEEMGLYWQCVEAADALHEAADRVRPVLVRYDPHPGRPP